MNKKRKFGIIGGDLRQYYLAKSLLKDGHDTLIFGFDKIKNENDNFKKISLSQVISHSDYVIFPVPITRDNKRINTPLSENQIYLDSQMMHLLKNKKVFGGMIVPYIEKYVKNNEFLFYDYYREDFIIPNASLTAEGAVKIFLEKSLISINKSKCLVAGYGRIGKILCEILKNFGANVTASARNIKDKSLIYQKGYHFVDTNHIIDDENLKSYDSIFNTIPSPIFSEDILSKLSPETIIIDLASEPGGIDKKSAEKLGIKFFHKLGIPGKYFPKSAGEITKKIIYQIITEENI